MRRGWKSLQIERLAVELDELSEILDARVASHVELPFDERGYARAYALAGSRAERERQIAMIGAIGHALDRLSRMPLVSGMLHIMRGPAEAAGLEHLHQFLVRGFDSFRAMGGAKEFLETIHDREIKLMRELFESASEA